jgi:hypothetical protein
MACLVDKPWLSYHFCLCVQCNVRAGVCKAACIQLLRVVSQIIELSCSADFPFVSEIQDCFPTGLSQ